MANTLSLEVTAQVADFEAKMALVRDSLKYNSQEMRDAAEAANNMVNPTEAARAAVEKFAIAVTKDKIELASLTQQQKAVTSALKEQKVATEDMVTRLSDYAHATNVAMRDSGDIISRINDWQKMSGGIKEAANAHGELKLATAGSTREFIVLGHEVMSGNFSRIPGSILVLMERMGGLHQIMEKLSGTTGIVIAAIGALALGFGYAIVQAVEFAHAVRDADAAMTFAGIEHTKEQVQAWVDQLRKFSGVTAETAEKTVAGFNKMRDATEPFKTAMIALLPGVARAWGIDSGKLEEANDRLITSFNDLGGAGLKELKGLTDDTATIDRFAKAVNEGARGEAIKILLTQIYDNLGKTTDAFKSATIAQRGFWDNATASMQLAEGNMQGLETLLLPDPKKLKVISDQIAAALEAPTKKPVTESPMKVIETQMEEAKGNIHVSAASIRADILSILELQKQKAHDANDVDAEREIDKKIANAKREAALALSQDLVNDARTRTSEIAATERGSATERLEAERAVYAKLITDKRLSFDAQLEAQRTYNQLSVQLDVVERAQKLASIRQHTDAARIGTHERVELATQEVAATIELYGRGSTQAIEAQKRQTAAELAEKLRRVQMDIADDNKKIAALDKQVAATIKSEDSKSAVTRAQVRAREDYELGVVDAATARRIELIQHELDAMEKAGLTETAEYVRAENDMTAAKAKGTQDRQAIQDRASQQQRKIDDQDARIWEQSFRPIASAFDSMIGDMMQGRGTLHQQLIGFASKWVQSELAADARMLLNKMALFAAEQLGFIHKETVEKITAQGTKGGLLGLVWDYLAGKEAADAADVASTTSTEIAKTGAVEAGAAVRSATALEEAVAGRMASKAAGSTSIMNDAYKAAAGAYASAADIPFVGWLIAPVAAAAAFTAVAAFDVLTAEGGMTVPSGVNPFVQLHEKEMVLPAAIATPLRAMLADRGVSPASRASAPIATAGGSGDNFQITVQAIDTKSGAQFLHNNARTIVSALRAQLRGGAPLPSF